jgi:hypothetical protein
VNRNEPVSILRAYEPRDRAMRHYARQADDFATAEQMLWLAGADYDAPKAHDAGMLCLKAYEAEWTNPEPPELVPCEDGQDTLPHIAAYLRAES